MELPLEVLRAAAVAAYLAARLPGPAVPAALVAALHRRTDGHPLFLVQLVEALVQQGVLRAGGRALGAAGRLAALDAVVPESLRQLIEQQLRRGSVPRTSRSLEAASVAGVALAGGGRGGGAGARRRSRSRRACEALARQGQFVPGAALATWPDGTVSGRYRFRHALYQQVVYDRVPVGRRVRLHQRLGAAAGGGRMGRRPRRSRRSSPMHFERGHDGPRPCRICSRRRSRPCERSAYQEAMRT